MTPSPEEIRDEILKQVHARGRGKTICPSEVARALADDWRDLMPQVREISDDLAAKGDVVVTQKGKSVRATEASGPVRIGLPPKG
jgi:hypothetical protein